MIGVLEGINPYVIPVSPLILEKISNEMNKDDVQIKEVVALLKQDVSLYTFILTTVNTPKFRGKTKINSLNQAVVRLGLKRLNAIIRVASLRSELTNVGPVRRFWDTAAEIAEITTHLASKFTKEDLDEAYTLGMLHECGVPLMMATFMNYRQFLSNFKENKHSELYLEENAQYGCNHFDVGSEIARRWGMPEHVCEAIGNQGDYQRVLCTGLDESEPSKKLLCCLLLAKDISDTYRVKWRNVSAHKEFRDIKPVLRYMGISNAEFIAIRESYLTSLEPVKES